MGVQSMHCMAGALLSEIARTLALLLGWSPAGASTMRKQPHVVCKGRPASSHANAPEGDERLELSAGSTSWPLSSARLPRHSATTGAGSGGGDSCVS